MIELIGAQLEKVGWPELTALDVAAAVCSERAVVSARKPGRNLAGASSAGMTWSRYAAGAAEVVPAETLCCGEARSLSRPVGVAHAVPAPVAAGTGNAVCGERVTV